MLKAVKLRIYPNTEQQTNIHKLLGSCRFVFNNCLNHKILEYKNNKNSLNLKELGKYFHNNLRVNHLWLKEENTKVVKQSIIDLLNAYKNFYEGWGFPNFKSKHNNKSSCRFPTEAISKKNDFTTNKINLIKSLNDLKFKTSDKNIKTLEKHKENIKSATLTKHKSGIYTLSILVDTNCDVTVLNKNIITSNPDKKSIIGIDLGIKDFIVTSNFKKFENIKTIRNNERKIKRLQRRLSKKQKGSKNREKCRIKLARYFETLNNKKENYLHLVVNELLRENQTIVIEDLSVSNMMKNHKLAKSIQELSLNRFVNILTYKSEWYGRNVIKIDRFYPSSKLCSCCKVKNNLLTLSDREWVCGNCGVRHDRDYNAAINIRDEGLRLLGLLNNVNSVTQLLNNVNIQIPLLHNPISMLDKVNSLFRLDIEYLDSLKTESGNNLPHKNKENNSIPIRNGELTPLEIVLDDGLPSQ